jgi:hypothetical protein
MKYLLLGFVLCCASILAAQSRTEEKVIALSKEMKTYFNPKEADKLTAFLDDRLVFIHSNGMTESKKEMIENLKTEKWALTGIDHKDISVRVYKNNTAVLVGKGLFHAVSAGKSVDLELYYTEIWSHVKKGWVLISRHANKIS